MTLKLGLSGKLPGNLHVKLTIKISQRYGTEKGHNGVEKTFYESAGSGGFSIAFPAPSYQKDALSTYFKNHNPPWPYFVNGSYLNNNGRYNRNGRGFPDLAAGEFLFDIT